MKFEEHVGKMFQLAGFTTDEAQKAAANDESGGLVWPRIPSRP